MALEQILIPEKHDLGGFSVQRSLPHRDHQMVGPFIFFDHLGPAVFPPGEGVDVRPHPHINLATVTYLLEGSLLHRDSLGVVQEIVPGEVNWMTAGRGVVHSERSPDSFRAAKSTLHAIQTWIALPKEFEEVEPSFSHHAADDLPKWKEKGTTATLIAGEFGSHTSPVQTFSPTIYLSLSFATNSQFQLPVNNQQQAIYSVTPGLFVDGKPLRPNCLSIVETGTPVEISAAAEAQAMVIGGKPLGSRQKYWNFVSSRAERIEQAKRYWREKRFPQVPKEEEFIPLPETASDRESSKSNKPNRGS
ncbi:pirin family protein [cf. Phormidesmis sp. LEGE 11477]|uniref:pirin family protein n=1 Tax=cf. Phormidesmis sp. LEGE 11477 TaxID=1828680 RepID=UPI001881FD41|nr:pirin family protein [cf. Phormidesmis sp. LEGE 11477]MBE9059662.1 pirin family protein [cf. Phormidesmis sp. LEGE 11477]